METSGGGIRISLPPVTDIDLDAAASGGRVNIESELRPRGKRSHDRFRGTLGRGGKPTGIA